MSWRKNASLALKSSAGASPKTAQPNAESPADHLEIAVLCTSFQWAAPALRVAAEIARRLNARVTMVVPEIVQFPAQLTDPPVALEWNEARFRKIALASPVPANVEILLCRDRMETIAQALSPFFLIVLAANEHRLWPTFEERLARALRRAGRNVIFAGVEAG